MIPGVERAAVGGSREVAGNGRHVGPGNRSGRCRRQLGGSGQPSASGRRGGTDAAVRGEQLGAERKKAGGSAGPQMAAASLAVDPALDSQRRPGKGGIRVERGEGTSRLERGKSSGLGVGATVLGAFL